MEDSFISFFPRLFDGLLTYRFSLFKSFKPLKALILIVASLRLTHMHGQETGARKKKQTPVKSRYFHASLSHTTLIDGAWNKQGSRTTNRFLQSYQLTSSQSLTKPKWNFMDQNPIKIKQLWNTQYFLIVSHFSSNWQNKSLILDFHLCDNAHPPYLKKYWTSIFRLMCDQYYYFNHALWYTYYFSAN